MACFVVGRLPRYAARAAAGGGDAVVTDAGVSHTALARSPCPVARPPLRSLSLDPPVGLLAELASRSGWFWRVSWGFGGVVLVGAVVVRGRVASPVGRSVFSGSSAQRWARPVGRGVRLGCGRRLGRGWECADAGERFGEGVAPGPAGGQVQCRAACGTG